MPKVFDAPPGFVLNPDYLVPELRAQRDALLEALKTIKDTKRLAREMQQEWCPAAQGMVRIASAAIKAVEGEKT
jgi:hypothetical protein